jgi:hypothetical protein
MSKVQRQLQKQLAHIRSIDTGRVIPPGERFKFDIRTLDDGSVFRMEDHTYLVLETGIYNETDDSFQKTLDWTGTELKLVCLETGTNHNLEWEEDDEIEVTLTLEEVNFSELKYDDGEPIALDSDDLDEIVEKNWEIMLDNKAFYYEDDYAARYTRNVTGKTENVYFYEFVSKDKNQLTIEVWIQQKGKEDFQAFLSRDIPPDDIEVISAPPRA